MIPGHGFIRSPAICPECWPSEMSRLAILADQVVRGLIRFAPSGLVRAFFLSLRLGLLWANPWRRRLKLSKWMVSTTVNRRLKCCVA